MLTYCEPNGVDPDPTSDDIETVYPLAENPVGSSDEIAVLVYRGLEPTHKHTGTEYEAHLIASSKGADNMAIYVVDGAVSVLAPGESIVMPPNTPHFAVAEADAPFTAMAISSPNFDPERMEDLSAVSTNPVEVRTLGLHEEVARFSDVA